MKKNLLSLTLCVALFTACKKEPGSTLVGEKTSVTFTVSDFTVSDGSLEKSGASTAAVGDTLKNYANNLYYRIYDSSGGLVKFKSQTSAQADFGTVADTLAAGTYTVVFTASKQSLNFANSSLSSDHFLDPSNTNWDDIFLKKLTLTVGATPINQAVRLDRIVAGLQLNLEEDPYGRFPLIRITVEDDDSIYQLGSLTSANPVAKTREWTIFFGKGIKSVFMHVLNTNRPAKVTIRAYDRAGRQVAEKIVDNVRFYANKKTVFSGRITEDANLTIKVDPIWNIKEPVQF